VWRLNGAGERVRIKPTSGRAPPDPDCEKEETMLKEFKDFLFRGNIIELAVAFVMGVAFVALVNSLVQNLVMPVIAMIIGKPDFSDLTFTINDAVYRYGAFLTDLIQFVAIAAAVFFFIVKPVQVMLARARREPIEEGMPDEERRHQELLAALTAISH
jgi:large conductance mechanosensitive channel